MTEATTFSAPLPQTATCGTCGGTFLPPVLGSDQFGDRGKCRKCAKAAQDARSAAQSAAYGVMNTTGTTTA